MFVPSVVSLSDTSYVCPKLMGLPAMLKSGLKLGSCRIVSPVIDLKDDPTGWRESWVKAAATLGIKDRNRVLRALDKGIEAWRFQERACEFKESARWDLAVMGHAYVLNDLLGLTIKRVAEGYGSVVTPDMVPASLASSALASIPEGHKMWSIEGQILGAALHLIRTGMVDRMIFVSTFSCGPASVMESFVAEEASRHKVPLLNLTVDEHTGDAGLITRVEAFLDAVHKLPEPVVKQTRSPEIKKVAQVRKREGPLGLVDMGSLGIPITALLEGLDVHVCPPPALSDRVVQLGKQIAPEFICYPMVTLLGQMRVMAEKGIRRILMVQGKGRCRLGWYAQVMENILRSSGYDVRVIAFDSPFPWREKGKGFLDQAKEIGGKYRPLSVLRAIRVALTKLVLMDRASERLREIRAKEKERGTGEALHEAFVADIAAAKTTAACVKAFKGLTRALDRVQLLEIDPLRVALVGEIYVLNEPFVNKDVERYLGSSLDHRVRVYRNLDVTGWMTTHLFRTPRGIWDYRKITEAASPYLDVNVGGHGQESLGETVLAQRAGFDGAIHLFPFTCMPEIIAQSILMQISSELDFPVMSLMISEQTGHAGFITRLEAFCDLLASRRQTRT